MINITLGFPTTFTDVLKSLAVPFKMAVYGVSLVIDLHLPQVV